MRNKVVGRIGRVIATIFPYHTTCPLQKKLRKWAGAKGLSALSLLQLLAHFTKEIIGLGRSKRVIGQITSYNGSFQTMLTKFPRLLQRLLLWFNENMTIILVALGSSLIAATLALLDKATETSTISWPYMCGVIVCIVLSIIAWSWALRREWKREKAQEQERKAQEQREIEREERDKKRFEEEKKMWQDVQLINP